MADPGARARTHEWSEPNALAESVRQLSGLEFFDGWARGEFTPPMAATLCFHLNNYEDGRVEIGCSPDEYHYNPYGMVHGGLTATLLDTATGCAVHTRLPAGTGYATLNLSVSYARPMSVATGEVRCIGEVVSMGRRVAMAEAELLDSEDRLLARGSATCLLIQPDA